MHISLRPCVEIAETGLYFCRSGELILINKFINCVYILSGSLRWKKLWGEFSLQKGDVYERGV